MARILFVVPREEVKTLASKIIQEYKDCCEPSLNENEDLKIDIIVERYGEKVDVRTYNPDIIVARGFTAIILKKLCPDIPIVEIPITTMDIVSSVMAFPKESINDEKIALVGFGNVSDKVHNMSKLCDNVSKLCHIHVVHFPFEHNRTDDRYLSMILDEVSSKGFRYIIAGMSTANIAKQKNLISTFIECGQESIWIAIRESQYIAGIRRKERERAAHLETILNNSHEGIISTDVSNKIIHLNSSAGKILDIDVSSCVDINLENIILDSNLKKMLSNKKEYSDELLKTKNGNIVLNKVVASIGNEMIGNVVTFQNINNIQNTEIKIRSKLHHRGLTAKYSFSDIIGESAILKEIVEKAQNFSKLPSNILIIGDTGTGKELFAQSIHNYSSRKNRPFVAVNCAAIPENLMESQFFGYASGAFTGASKEGKSGFFELAHEGTIFLDEISEIPLNLQSKLLRVIQESEVMRIGDDKIIPINVRIICASNKDLNSLVTEGKFRKDLYYRLCVLQLRIPLLHERGQDILLISNHYISQYSSAFSKNNILLSLDAQKLFLNYSWDGNIRELSNVCEQLVALNKTGIISAEEVSSVLPITSTEEKVNYTISEPPLSNNLPDERRQLEKNLIIKALKESKYNKTKAASILCINPSTLWRKLKEYNIEY